jgi:hypothetical protein
MGLSESSWLDHSHRCGKASGASSGGVGGGGGHAGAGDGGGRGTKSG